jgi:hypothetical protein
LITPRGSLFRFARKDQNELTPSLVTDALGETMILDHPFDIQIFDGDRVKLSRDLESRLVVEIRALASNLLIFPQKTRPPRAQSGKNAMKLRLYMM